METSKEFDKFYDTYLLGKLDVLNKERKRFLKFFFAMLVALTGATVYLVKCQSDTKPAPLVVFIVTTIISFVLLQMLYREYNSHFKPLVIGALIDFVKSGFIYSPDGSTEKDFIISEIFFRGKDVSENDFLFEGHDLVEGKLGKTQFSFSELRVTKNGSLIIVLLVPPVILLFLLIIGYNTAIGLFPIVAKYVTIQTMGIIATGMFVISFLGSMLWHDNPVAKSKAVFKGIFFTADFNKSFNGNTFVLPGKLEQLRGWLSKLVHKSSDGKGELVELESGEFAKEFSVYSSDQVEARYILTPGLMERILKFQREINSSILLSFVNSSVYVGIPVWENLLEAKIFSMGGNKEYLQRYVNYLQLAIDIVEELDLNTRIWTKK